MTTAQYLAALSNHQNGNGTMNKLVIATLIAAIITTIAASLYKCEIFSVCSFKERFQPAIDYPLHSKSSARQGFCFPGKCRIG